MKKFFFWFLLWFFSFLLIQDWYQATATGITLILFSEVFLKSNQYFVFREWALLLYSINYLLSPAITYNLPEENVQYGMKILSDEYFELAIPGFLLFTIGLYAFSSNIFYLSYSKVRDLSIVNSRLLVIVTIIGLLSKVIYGFLPTEIAFIFYLISLLRFVGIFSLSAISFRKYYLLIIIVFLFEAFLAFTIGMYHDFIMWIVFYSLFFVYVFKPSLTRKILGITVIIFIILFIQSIKFVYREEVWSGEKDASLQTIADIGSRQSQSDILLGESNLLSILNRGNQAWIFASTVENMKSNKNYQGLTIVNRYLEAAILPRFLAPNKISSGDKEIFNEFTGHSINENTSMGIGIFADGYIAYGAWGVYIFGFVLGLIFSLTFKLVERWTKVSPFYVLLLLPLLNYAVRPDCELQTTINHLFKGILLYGFLVYLTRKRFTLDSQENQRKLLHLNLATKK